MTTRTITLPAEHWQTIKNTLLNLCVDDPYVSPDLSVAYDALDAALAQPEPETSRLHYCDVHGQQPENAWGCPECVREMRHQLAQLEGEGPSVEQMYYWALKAIRQYGLDTLSGRADGGADNREWQRAAVVEMVRRAQTALDYGGPGSRPAIEPVPTSEPEVKP